MVGCYILGIRTFSQVIYNLSLDLTLKSITNGLA